MMVCGTARAFDADRPMDAGARGRGRRWRWTAAAVAMLAAWVTLVAGAATAPDPPLRIPLGPMGYQTMAQEFLLEGDSVLTVHFVDADHLLVTFAVRRLMKRDPDPR